MKTEPAHPDDDADVALGLTPSVRRPLYEQMVLNRAFETEAERQYKAARIGGYCHLSSGQEATTAGVVHALRDDDLLSPATAVTASRWRLESRRRRSWPSCSAAATAVRTAAAVRCTSKTSRAASTAAGASSRVSCQ